MSIKTVINTKFKEYRAEFATAENLDEKLEIANLFDQYLAGAADAAAAFGHEDDEISPILLADKVNKADIAQVESEHALNKALA